MVCVMASNIYKLIMWLNLGRNKLKIYWVVIIASTITLLGGCVMEKEGAIERSQANTISTQYVLDFWSIFKEADFAKMEKYYDDEVTLLPRAMLGYKSLGISPDGYSHGSRKYSKRDIFNAYNSLEKELGGKRKWKHLFSDINMEVSGSTIELSTVENSKLKIKPYVLHRTARDISGISLKDIVFVVRGERKGRDKLIFVLSNKTKKIIAQTMIITFPGSHYFDGFKEDSAVND